MPAPSANTSIDLHLPERLVIGYESFLTGRFAREQSRFHQLAAKGQNPSIMLIGCCDSRVSPEVIFDAGPGEIFVVRNVANLVPPYAPNDDLHGTSAALEYAVLGLGVEHVVVFGHASCGGVRAFAENALDPTKRPLSSGDFIGKWISLIGAAAEKIGPTSLPLDDYCERLALASIVQGLENLRSFPAIAAREKQGDLSLHGAYFSIAEGKLLALDEANGRFEAVSAKAHGDAFAEPRF
ncbi:carbonic anhydrase [Methylocapsa palsarum]|uniref:Carbonic anhydrase n=1 Tax=Methylocapsa palsarum TaxID=1612308 RepID=A0A1I4C3X0_9HYPH|nr:carbonic anhydrase [Methylocapsa palsarum]SFK75782.1 carbonic anhydrase [Methylocapsa palsarum]